MQVRLVCGLGRRTFVGWAAGDAREVVVLFGIGVHDKLVLALGALHEPLPLEHLDHARADDRSWIAWHEQVHTTHARARHDTRTYLALR